MSSPGITVELTVVVTRPNGTRTVLGSEVLTRGGDGNPAFLGHEIAEAIGDVLNVFTDEHALVLRPAPGSTADAAVRGAQRPDTPRNEPPAWLSATRPWRKAHVRP